MILDKRNAGVNMKHAMPNTKRKNPAAVALGRLGGSKATAAQKAAARRNGALGGRPRKVPENTRGGEYFKRLRKPVTVCVAKRCPHIHQRVNLQFKP